MSLFQFSQVRIREDVHVVDEETPAAAEKFLRREYASSCVQQLFLLRDVDSQLRERIPVQPFLYHGGEVVDVDDDVPVSGRLKPMQGVPEQRLPADFDESLGPCVGQGAQSCAEPCRENHSCLFHVLDY